MNKKVFILIMAFFATAVLSAQVPLTFTYQAVVRDAQGRLVCNNNVGVQLSILQGSADGIVVYSDRQTAHTNANGLFTVLIGTDGNSLSHVDWAAGPYFLKSEVDPTGGTSYTLTTVQQMFSVPYAIRAHLADSVSNETDPLFMSWPKDYNDLINRPTNVSTFINDAGYLTTETDPIFSAWDKDYDDLTNKPTNVSTFTNDAGYLTTESDPIFTAWDKDYDDLTNKPTNVSTFTNDAGYLTTETDPVFSAWDKDYDDLTNKPTNVSTFTNDAGYLTTETDPVFSAWDKDYDDLTNKPTNVSTFTNDAGYLTTETDPVFSAWDKDYDDLTNKPTNVSTFTNDAGYLTTETDPVFSAWDKDYDDLTNKPTNVSTFTNDAGYLTTETDPVFSAWDKDYDDLTNKPTNVSTFTNDAGYLTTESDPIFSAWTKDYNDLTNKPTIPTVPTNVSAFTNDAGYLTSYTETDPQFSAWTKDYNDLTNKPTIPTVPTNVSAFTNDAGYLTSYTETDPQFNAWTKDYNDLTNKPTIPTVPTNVSAFTNDAGYITTYTEMQDLANVTALGNSANSQIKNLSDPTDDMDAVNKRTMDSTITVSVSNAVNNIMHRYDSIIAQQQHTIDSLEALLNVTIHIGDTSATACNSFVWYGTEYTASGDYVKVLASSTAGDSVVTLHLTINHPSNVVFNEVACDSLIWLSGNGETYTNSGSYVYSHLDANGCLQNDTLCLVIHNSPTRMINITATDSYTWYGVTYTSSCTQTHVKNNADECDSIITLNLTIIPGPFTSDGATRSAFRVGTNKNVHFSRGNLQYKATGSHAVYGGGTKSGTWRFALNQYGIIGAANLNPTNAIGAWGDLFSWHSSGYTGTPETCNNCYDWGRYNAISNGGNTVGYWRSLTKDEWDYLVRQRPNASAKFGRAQVCGVTGLIILPNSWNLPNGLTFTSGYIVLNTYSASEWEQMEANGAVFLPNAGAIYSSGGSDYYDSYNGDGYWAAPNNSHKYGLNTQPPFTTYNANTGLYSSCFEQHAPYYKFSVRLVHDCE